MEINVLTGVGLLLIVTIVLTLLSSRKKSRPPHSFLCRKCKQEFPHNSRTLMAWQSHKQSFYCDNCHRAWRLSNPQPNHTPRFIPERNGSGCLGFVVLLAFVPLGYLIF